ncbi:arylsulfatase [soil metagenome]
MQSIRSIIPILISVFFSFCNTPSINNPNNSEITSNKIPDKRPNIILIMADDMGYSDLGWYGSEIKTPNLDKLASNGLSFSQFYNTARCCPTRASLMTGLYPAQTGVGFMINNENMPGYRGDLNNQCVTIAEVLKPSGYNTYMSGKWHVTRQLQDIDSLKYNWPRQRGFDKFYGTVSGAASYWDPYTLTRDNTYITPENDPEYQPEQYFYTDAISDNAVNYVQQHYAEGKNNPFFMYVAFTAPHWPLQAPEDEIEQYKGKYDQGFEPIRKERFNKLKEKGLINKNLVLSDPVANWDTVQNKSWHSRNMEVYAAMITRMDKGIGKIVQALEQAGELENTLIFFLQDNGGCAEEVYWLRHENALDTFSTEPLYLPMDKNEIQTKTAPVKNRQGFPVVVQSKKVLAGSDQTYHSYGATWANVSNTPFREFKHWVHEGGVSTPLIIHWPAAVEGKGLLIHQPSHLIDIMATCVEVARATYPTNFKGNQIVAMEGSSLVPVLLNNEKINREAIYFEHEGNRAIRKGKWKLVSKAFANAGHFKKMDSISLDQWELYDMENDRTETTDLAKENPQLVKDLSANWYKWAERTQAIPKPG